MRKYLSVVVLLSTGFIHAHAAAQPTAGASLVHVEGDVFLNEEAVPSNSGSTLLPNSAGLRTSQGRAAVELKRGGFLFLDARTSVRVLDNGVYNFNRIEALTGSVIVASETSSPLVDCESDIRLSDGGIFRFDVQRVNPVGERSCRTRVFEGAAAVPLVTVTNALRAGEMMMCNRRCGDMVPTTEFSREQLDDFDRWARRMREQLRK